MKKLRIPIISIFYTIFANAQPIGWEDAAFRDPGGGGGSVIFYILGIIFFIWVVNRL